MLAISGHASSLAIAYWNERGPQRAVVVGQPAHRRGVKRLAAVDQRNQKTRIQQYRTAARWRQ